MLSSAVPSAFAAPAEDEGESADVVITETGATADVSDEPQAEAAAETPASEESISVPEETSTVPEEPTSAPAQEAETAAPTEAADESAPEIVDSGTCGDDLTWTLDDAGTLTISGTGVMRNYSNSSDNRSLFYDNDSIISVVIEDGVTYIGEYAFYDCDALTNITLPDSLVSIGDRAFYDCDALTSISLSDSVTSIGEYAFSYCYALTSITLPDSLVSIGDRAFYDCAALDSVYISDLAAYLNINFSSSNANPMYYADKLYLNNKRVSGELVIPDGVTKIPAYAFEGCDGITSVSIPASVTTMEYRAFYNCPELKDVYISDLSQWCGISFGNTSSNPLFYAENLYLNGEPVTGDIAFPDDITSIGSCAFYNYDKLTRVTIPENITAVGSYAFSSCDALTDVKIGNGVASIGENTFYNCGALTTVTIGNGIASIGKDAFKECLNIAEVYISDLSHWCAISFGNAASNPIRYSDTVYVNNASLTRLVIPDGVTAVNDFAFYNADTISSVIIPDSVTSIGYSAFCDCSSLTGVTIPDSVTSIDNYAFYDCDSVSDITIPNSVTSIGKEAFYGCDDLTTLSIGSGLETIGDHAFYNCPALEEVYYNAPTVSSNLLGSNNAALIVLGSNVTSIDVDAFSGCGELRRIFIPKSVTEIEQGAFADCSKLTTVEYEGSQEDWEQVYIGTNNDPLRSAQVEYNSLAENAALTDEDLLTYAVNDDSTITITNCYQNATNIDIPAEIDGMPVTSINSSAFANRTRLESVTIPSSVTSIGEDAFSGCSALTSITIPEGVTTIGNSAFYNCSAIKNVTLPKSLTSIERYAFYGCLALTDVYYAGSEEEWQTVSVGYSNTPLTDAAMHYNGETPEPEPTPLPVIEAEITKTETETGYSFEVTPETAYEGCSVYAAIYDENGALIGLGQVPLSTEGSTSVEVSGSENDSRARVFVWSDVLQPITVEKTFIL